MQIKKRNRNKKIIICSLLLIIIGTSIIGTKYLYHYLSRLEDDKKIEEYFEKQTIIPSNRIIKTNKNNKEENTEKYIAVLEIPKINLKRGIYAKNSKLNNVNKNILLLKESNYPNEDKGNFILAGHSGSAYFSYFKNLQELSVNDKAYVYYDGIKYEYELLNIYEIVKNGKANIVRNGEKTIMTLITCKHGTNKQLVYIFERKGDSK